MIAAIGNGSAPEYQKSKDSVRKAHGTLRRERDTALWAAEMADDVKQIYAPRASQGPIETVAVDKTIVDRALGAASFGVDQIAAVQGALDGATTISNGVWTTDFQGAALSLAAPYIETLFSFVWSRIDEHLGGGPQSAKKVVDVVGRVQTGVGATVNLATTLSWCAVNIPDSVKTGLGAFANPGKALLKAVTVKVIGNGIVHTTDAAVPLTKLLQPLASMATLLRQYPKIDAMHALHQRLPSTSACRDAAFQIVDKWENDLVNQVAGGHQVFAFLTAMKAICSAGGGGAMNSPASVLLAAARGETGTESDRNHAFLVLATLCGGGHGRKGIDKAVAAIVSGPTGLARIQSLI